MVFENFTFEEWQEIILEKRRTLEDTIKNNIPHLWESIQLITAVKCILNIKDCTLPLMMILLGAASSLKTVPIEMFRRQPNTYYTDNFSAKAFVSHSTAVKKEELSKIDMLPKIQYNLFLAPELAPLFTKKDEDLIETLGILTRIADGRGYENDTGAHGHRGYVGDYMFTMVGAAIDIPFKVHKYLGNLGPKLYFFRLPKLIRKDEDYFNQLKDNPFSAKFQNIKTTLIDYLQWLEKCPNMEVDKDSKLKKIVWDSDKDDDEALYVIIKLGRLLAHLRANVPTWETKGSGGTDYAYATAMKEEPDRAMEVLRNISRGLALSKGRNYITKEDLSLPIKIVLSTASIDRVNIFDLLIAHEGTLTTKIITKSLDISPPTAYKVMIQLKAVGLVNMPESETTTEEKQITLKDDFKWFLSDEFKQLRLDYTYGVGTIYDKAELDKLKQSVEWPREYQLQWLGKIGNVCLPNEIENCISLGKQYANEPIGQQTLLSCGIDWGFSSSATGIVLLERIRPIDKATNQINDLIIVRHSELIEKGNVNTICDNLFNLYRKHHNVWFVTDGSNRAANNLLKIKFGESPEYDSNDVNPDNMKVVPINFGTQHKDLLSHMQSIVSNGYLAIPEESNAQLLTALRTAYAKELSLDKNVSVYNDLTDALRLSLRAYNII